ncbi:MAG TPA: hypothetical protein ENK05_12715 [Gammaproteobacteria bacterium]|nr:hypothetical protein [Gammaproteobacteria bacterium]
MLSRLLSGCEPSLASWFADPLPRAQAKAWLARIRRQRHSGHAFSHCAAVAELIAGYWADQQVEPGFANLAATLAQAEQRALPLLCYGQLLLARRRRAAWEWLQPGFELAAPSLEPQDYFRLLRRHECLRALPLGDQAMEPASLHSLLREARVIRRLQGGREPRRPLDRNHVDTLG